MPARIISSDAFMLSDGYDFLRSFGLKVLLIQHLGVQDTGFTSIDALGRRPGKVFIGISDQRRMKKKKKKRNQRVDPALMLPA